MGLFTDLVEIIGEEATLALCAARGGQVVYIPAPENLTDTHWIIQTLKPTYNAGQEWDVAALLTERWRCEVLTLPLGPEAGSRNGLQRQELDLASQGVSANSIARLTGLTIRTVRRIKRRGQVVTPSRRKQPDPRQGRLFDEDVE